MPELINYLSTYRLLNMRLITIFGKDTNAIYAIQYSGQDKDELDRLFGLWSDFLNVKTYLQERNDLMTEAFRKGIKIEEAVWEIIREAELIENELLDHFRSGSLQYFFMPLRNDDTNIYVFQPSKAKSKSRKIRRPKIRIYAIRLASNCYVITGGGIKMTKSMQDCPLLIAELKKLNKSLHFLKQHEISDIF